MHDNRKGMNLIGQQFDLRHMLDGGSKGIRET